MNTPTRHAPHICCHVLAKISPSCLPFTRSSTATMIHDAKIAEPPTNGVQLNTAPMVAPWVIEDAAETAAWNRTIFGRLDHGPVQSVTTTTSTRIGSHAWKMSLPDRPCAGAEATPVIGLPP